MERPGESVAETSWRICFVQGACQSFPERREHPWSRWINENSVLAYPRSCWIARNNVLEPPRNRWIDENSVLEYPWRRWIDENSVLEHPRSRWITKNIVLDSSPTVHFGDDPSRSAQQPTEDEPI